MVITRFKNYRFNFHFGNYTIVISYGKRLEYVKTRNDVEINLWKDKIEMHNDPSTIEDFKKSIIGKALNLDSFESLYRATIISIFKNGVIDHLLGNGIISIHTSVDKDYL